MKSLLGITLGILLLFMFLLLERRGGLNYYLNQDQGFLFVALAILAGSSLIALCAQSSPHEEELYRAFCKVTTELENGPLSRKELGAKIGSRHVAPGFEDEGTSFSQHQSVILERLIYEGKIRERNGKLSLPS